MNRIHILLTMLITAFVFSACGVSFNVDIDEGSGVIITEDRPVSNFDRVSLSGLGDVTLTQGNNESLKIEAEDNVVANITTEVRDGTLFIGFERKSVIPTKPVKFTLSMRTIHGLETRGVSNIKAESIETDQLDISISGTGNITIDDLSAEGLSINVSGAGNFNTEGQVEHQKVTLSGAGNYAGEDLESQSADITITGLGRVTVWVTEKLDVTISGTGSIDYYGNPQVSQQISGLGKLNHKGDK